MSFLSPTPALVSSPQRPPHELSEFMDAVESDQPPDRVGGCGAGIARSRAGHRRSRPGGAWREACASRHAQRGASSADKVLRVPRLLGVLTPPAGSGRHPAKRLCARRGSPSAPGNGLEGAECFMSCVPGGASEWMHVPRARDALSRSATAGRGTIRAGSGPPESAAVRCLRGSADQAARGRLSQGPARVRDGHRPGRCASRPGRDLAPMVMNLPAARRRSCEYPRPVPNGGDLPSVPGRPGPALPRRIQARRGGVSPGVRLPPEGRRR